MKWIVKLLWLISPQYRKLKGMIKSNPIGLKIFLSKNCLTWEKVGLYGDFYISKYFYLNYKGSLTKRKALQEIIDFLSKVYTFDELNELKKIELDVRGKLSKLNKDAQINIGTKSNPVYVNLGYGWGYYDNGVYVETVSQQPTALLNNMSTGTISYYDMFFILENNDIIPGNIKQKIEFHLSGGGGFFA